MPAYVIVDIEVINPQIYDQVKALTPSIVRAYGGKYLARGGRTEILSGSWHPQRLVILEFESMQAALSWESSTEYTELKNLRNQSARVNMVVVQGVNLNQ